MTGTHARGVVAMVANQFPVLQDASGEHEGNAMGADIPGIRAVRSELPVTVLADACGPEPTTTTAARIHLRPEPFRRSGIEYQSHVDSIASAHGMLSSAFTAPNRSTPPPPSFFGLVGIARERLDILDRTYKRDRQGQFSSGGGVTGQAALDAVPANLAPGERGHFGDYEGESLSGPPGMGSARALSEYEGVEYDRTNGYLRHGPLADRLAGQPGVHDLDGVRQMDAETAARIADIDQTMAASRLAADVQVERGVGRGQDLFGDAWHEGVINKDTKDFDEQDREYDRWVAGERPDLTGLRFRDKGYTSTTADPHVAEQFVASRAKWKQESPDSEGEPVVMKIQVPAGTGAVQLGTMAAPGAKLGRQDSAEILLERGLTYEVTADHGVDAAGFRRLDVSVVPGG